MSCYQDLRSRYHVEVRGGLNTLWVMVALLVALACTFNVYRGLGAEDREAYQITFSQFLTLSSPLSITTAS